jgi:hypothetical protein
MLLSNQKGKYFMNNEYLNQQEILHGFERSCGHLFKLLLDTINES